MKILKFLAACIAFVLLYAFLCAMIGTGVHNGNFIPILFLGMAGMYLWERYKNRKSHGMLAAFVAIDTAAFLLAALNHLSDPTPFHPTLYAVIICGTGVFVYHLYKFKQEKRRQKQPQA